MRTAFPTNRVVKLRYIQSFELDPGAGNNFVANVFSANSINDPDVTGGGHQPMGHDQWATWYNRYTVIGAKISMLGITSSTSVPAIFGVRTIDLSTTGHTTIEGLMETPKVSWKFMQTAVNGNVPRPATTAYSAKKWFNLTNIKDNHTHVGAAFGANPATQVYFYCFYGRHGSDSSTDLPKLHCVAKITYICLMSHAKELPQS